MPPQKNQAAGLGLYLVDSLMPRKGGHLQTLQLQGEVHTQLDLHPPVASLPLLEVDAQNKNMNRNLDFHILLVDDDQLVLATLAVSLVRVGYQVTRAESAEESKESLEDGRRPDLVTLDLRVPGQGGLCFARRLCELDHILFVMLSACSEAAICKYRHLTRCARFFGQNDG